MRKLSELEIRGLFDAIKVKFGLRLLGKGFIYRIVSPKEIKDISTMTDEEKENGINSEREVFVRYDKGDRDGNKWLSDTPYLINWNVEGVSWLKNNSGKSGVGMPVVRNPQFYFKDGLSWNIINGTRNSNNLKFKYILPSVNDVGGMKLTTSDEAKRLLTDKFLCCVLNSYLNNRLTESFINFTVNFQMNDARQIPIIIPTQKELEAFEKKYDECFATQEEYFAGKLDKTEARLQLLPIEAEIDEMVNNLYGIEAIETVDPDLLEEDVLDDVQIAADDEE